MLPLTSNLAFMSVRPTGLMHISTLPFALVVSCSWNSVSPLSLAARKNACKLEWCRLLDRDLLLISTIQCDYDVLSPENFGIARKVHRARRNNRETEPVAALSVDSLDVEEVKQKEP